MTLPLPTTMRALLALLASVAVLQWSPAPASAAGGSISGTVADAAGHAITTGDVCVTAYGYDPATGSVTVHAQTSATGTYTLGSLADLSYSIWFEDCSGSPRNDLSTYYGATADHPDATPVVVSGGVVTDVDVALAAGTSISGHVYGGAGTGNPVDGICVSAGNQTGVTDVTGAYALKHLAPGGHYTVFLSACDNATPYLSRYVGGDDDGGGGTTFTPTLQAPVANADEHLTLGGTIAGTVADAAGHAITTKDVCVSASGVGAGANYRSARSAADGTFAIRGLKAGKYQISYGDCSDSARNDVPAYLGGSANPTGLDVRLGATHGGVALQLAAATTIAGHVYGGADTGTPLQNACVSASPAGDDGLGGDYVTTAADGSYTLRHIAPGTGYKLSFSPCSSNSPYVSEYYNNKPTWQAADPLVVPAAGTTSLDAHLTRGASISGTVVDADGHAITTQDICVSASPAAGDGSYAGATTDASGAFTVVGLTAGTYHLRFSDCGGSRNDADLAYQENGSADLTLTLGQAKTGVVAHMLAATSISGHVYGGAGTSTPLKSACVDIAKADEPAVEVAYAGTDATGAYSVGHLTPGIPYVAHFRPCSAGAQYTDEWYSGQSSSANANAVTPTAGNPSTGIDGHLPTGASIAGTVTDAAGHAITTQDICVSASPVTYASGAYGANAKTGADGKYSIVGLAAGSYYVFFSDCGSSRNDVSQYYGGASDSYESTIVVLSSSGAKSGVDAQLAAGTTISGTLYAGTGTAHPLTYGCVDVEAVNGDRYYYDSTDADGHYEVAHVAPVPGGYRVKAEDCDDQGYVPRYYGGDFRRSSGTVLHPTVAQPASGVDVHLSTGATITGTVRDAGGVVTDGVCLMAERYGNLYDDYFYGYGSVDRQGHYSVVGLPSGNYTVYAYDCGDARNDLEQYVGAPPVGDGATVSGVDVTMRPAAAISGHVYGGAGTAHPLGDVCVTAYSSYSGDYPIYGDYPSYYWEARVQTKSDGSYTIKHLTPGEAYKIGFNECFDDNGLSYGSQYFDGVSDLSQAATLRVTVANPATGVDAHLPGVDAAPDTTITGGPAADAATNQTSARFSFISDQSGATFECAVDGHAYAPCTSPYNMSGLSTGSHSFSVRARRNGRVDPTPPVVSWTVDPASPTSTSQGALTAGGTFSSDAGAAPTATVPVIADVTLPVSGQVTLTKEPATTPSGNGYTVFGQQIDIAATAAGGGAVSGTTAQPIVLGFKLDGSQLPAGTDRGAITVLRNGVAAPACTSDDGSATPDPCVSNRRDLAGGGLEIDVLTTHCSTWNFAASAAAAPAPVNSAAPKITGTPALGATLTASEGGWTGSGVTYAYQWLRDGMEIAGATGKTYTISAADQGHHLAVRVTATNGSGQASATSAAVDVPAAQGGGGNTGDGGGDGNPGGGGGGNPGGGGGGGSTGGGGDGGGTPVIGNSGAPPTLTLAPIGKVRLGALARTGLPLRLSCSRACRAEIKVTIPAAVAKRLKLAKGRSAVVIASARANLTTKPKPLAVHLAAKAAKALRRSRSPITATVTIRVSDARGATTTTRTITIRR